MTKRNFNLVLTIFILIKFALQSFVINPFYELQRDEFLHLDQGKHLAWGFLSVPPATSWFSWIIIHLGSSIFWIKFFPALFGVLTLVVVAKTIQFLKGNLFALTLGLTGITFSALVRMNTLYQPNSLEILFWTLFYYSLIRYYGSLENKWLLIAGAVAGLAFLNKYNIVFLLITLIPAIVLSGNKKTFSNKYLYIAALIFFIIISPNLYWQYQHHFVVFHHLSTLQKTQLVNVNRIDFLKNQILFFLGSIFILIAGFISFYKYDPFKKYRVILLSFVFCLLLFVYLKAKDYYAIGLYPIFFAFGGVYIEYLLRARRLRFIKPALIIIIILFFIGVIKYAFAILSPQQIIADSKTFKKIGLLRWEDGKDHQLPQDFADMTGWKELAGKVDSCYNLINDKQHTAILCNNYGEAGAINYYSRFKNINALTQNADYVNWFHLNIPIYHVISIKDSSDPDSLRTNEQAYFNKIQYFGRIENPYSRESKTNVYFFDKPKVDINLLLKTEIAKTKLHTEGN